MSRRFRLAFILPSTGGTNVGGMEMVAANLLHSLDPLQYSLSLVCFEGTNGIIPRIDRSRVSIEVIEKKPGSDLLQVLRLARYFRRTRPCLVHTFNEQALVFGWPAARIAKVPVLVHAWHGRTGEKEGPLVRALRRGAMKRVDHVVVVSRELELLVLAEAKVPPERVTRILNGVDLSQFDSDFDRVSFRRELELEADDWAVCAVGSLQPLKNQELLIRAAARVDSLRLFIVGSGPLEQELRLLARELRVEERVSLLGERSNVPEILRAMDVFCLTSTTEGTSLALLEAMAASLPALVTDVGGNRELVVDGDTGFLIGSNDLNALTEKLAWSLRNRDEARRMGAAARRRAERFFSFSDTVATYHNVFQAALRRKGIQSLR